MEEGSKPTSFNEYRDETEEEHIIDAEEIPQFEGVCDKCLGSGYIIREKNGVMGVVFTSDSSDSEGKPIKRLLSCSCKVETRY